MSCDIYQIKKGTVFDYQIIGSLSVRLKKSVQRADYKRETEISLSILFIELKGVGSVITRLYTQRNDLYKI